jgi:hypothetical protein
MRYWKAIILVWVFNVKSQNMMIKGVTKMVWIRYVSGSGKCIDL